MLKTVLGREEQILLGEAITEDKDDGIPELVSLVEVSAIWVLRIENTLDHIHYKWFQKVMGSTWE